MFKKYLFVVLLIALLFMFAGCSSDKNAVSADSSDINSVSEENLDAGVGESLPIVIGSDKYILPCSLKTFYDNGIRITDKNIENRILTISGDNNSVDFMTNNGTNFSLNLYTGGQFEKKLDNVEVKLIRITAPILDEIKVSNILLNKATIEDFTNKFGEINPDRDYYGYMDSEDREPGEALFYHINNKYLGVSFKENLVDEVIICEDFYKFYSQFTSY